MSTGAPQQTYAPPAGIQPSSNSMANCCSDPSAFIPIHIHTAKCSQCDKRNQDLMRRCPGCTWQICKPCFELKHAAGKDLKHGNMARGPATPARAPVRRKLFTPINSLATEGGGVKEVVSDAREGVGQEWEMRPTGEGAVKRKRVAKPQRSNEDASDDEFVPPGVVTMTAAKRRKPVVDDCAQSVEMATPTRTDSNAESTARVVPFSPGNATLQQLLDEHGIRYHEQHLLSRHPSVSSDPIIVASFQAKAAANALTPNQDRSLEGFIQTETRSIRQFIESQVHEVQEGIIIDKDQEATLLADMQEAGRKYIVKFRNASVPDEHIHFNLDTPLKLVSLAQLEMICGIVREQGRKKVKDFEEEAGETELTSSP